MFIDQSMTRDVITVGPEMSIIAAREIMVKNGIRHLPVVAEDDILVGIVTDRDIRTAMPSTVLSEAENAAAAERLAGIKVKDVMTARPVTVSPTQTLEDALLMMEMYKVGAFPVVDQQGRLRGIISVRDLMRAFVNVLGLRTPGVLVGIVVEDKLGQMKKIVDAISELGVSFGSILVARVWEEGKRAVFPYLLTTNIARVNV
ncbi:MAG: CBS domain-containing protein, partial [Deltaproteobacteria bacterium]|nr:CBS domain-containing protein [Deltaproteobacteria bacterium]